MLKRRLVLGVLAAAGAFVLAAASASAEFTSHDKSSEGKSTLTKFGFTLEGVGATIDCGSLESGPSWQIKSKGTPAEVGSLLALKFKSLGSCLVAYKESGLSKEVKATSGECAWEVSEPLAEMLVAGSDVSTCTISPELSKACEVKIEPTGNKNREIVALFDSGEADENLDLNLELSKMLVGVAGSGCEAAGIKSSSLATLEGAIEAQQVAPGMAAPKFKMSYNTNSLGRIGAKGTGFVTNQSGAAAKPEEGTAKLLANGSTALVKIANKTVLECAGTLLNNLQSCPMELTLESATRGVKSVYLQYLEGRNVASEVTFFLNA